MGRKSKLTDEQWHDIGARLLAGESCASLAREYGVAKSSISERFSERNRTVRVVAERIVATESAVMALPIAEQKAARGLASTLMEISMHAAGSAKFGMATSHRLAGIAHGLVQQIDDANPLESMEALKAVAVISKVANEAAHVGLNLLAANKGVAFTEPPEVPKTLPYDVMDAAAIYAKVMGD